MLRQSPAGLAPAFQVAAAVCSMAALGAVLHQSPANLPQLAGVAAAAMQLAVMQAGAPQLAVMQAAQLRLVAVQALQSCSGVQLCFALLVQSAAQPGSLTEARLPAQAAQVIQLLSCA